MFDRDIWARQTAARPAAVLCKRGMKLNDACAQKLIRGKSGAALQKYLDLTLFPFTPGGISRMTVHCERPRRNGVENGSIIWT